MHGGKEQKREYLIIGIVLVISILLHFYLADFSKTIETFPDEARYFGIAKSIYYGRGISIRGIPSDYQKILYSVLLVPFFSITNIALRMKAIYLLNSILMSLSIIPAWMIAKELDVDKQARYILLGIVVLWPDQLYCVTFMAEVLYWPLFLWFIYIWILNERKQKYWLAIVEGVLCYLGYLTKEIFLALFLAYICFEIVYPIIERVAKQHYKMNDKQRLIIACLFIFTFVICHFSVKFLFFRGMGNSYNQMGLDALEPMYNKFYLLYAFFYYIIATMVVVMIIPIIYPIIHYNELHENIKKTFTFDCIFIGGAAATVAYTISIREDLGRIAPRLHMRYFSPAFIIMFIIFFGSIRYGDLKKKDNIMIGGSIISSLVVAFIYKGLTKGSSVDGFDLDWTHYIINKLPSIDISGDILYKSFYPGVFAFLIIWGSLVCVIVWTIFHKKQKQVIYTFSAIIIVLSLLNSYFSYRLLKESYTAEESAIEEALKINSYCKKLKGNILYVTDSTCISKLSKIIDVYLDYEGKIYYVKDTILDDLDLNMSYDIGNLDLKESIWGKSYEKIDNIEYIIVENTVTNKEKVFSGIQKIDGLCGGKYSVYKNIRENKLSVELNDDYCYNGEKLIISFSNDNYNANKYSITGVSGKEDGFSWTEGNEINVKIPVIKGLRCDKAHITLNIIGTFNGKKEYVIKQEDSELESGILDGASKIEFDVDVIDDYIKFEIEMPDAECVNSIYPENNDTRKVAFQLESLQIEKQ